MKESEISTDRVADAVSSVAERGLSFELSTQDLCFLVALHIGASHHQVSSFGEEQLQDIFSGVCRLVDPGVARSSTRAIARLREQKMLLRVDGLGVVRVADYALTRLATAIVEYVLEEETLTKDSLSVLTTALLRTLVQIRDAANEAVNEDEWSSGVVVPLQVTSAELARGIERRQRGLDQQQERFQATIRAQLDSNWFEAIETCQELLESTGAMLQELSDLLLEGTYSLLEVLQDIQHRAVEVGHDPAASATRHLMDTLDQIAGWGTARQRAWSDYFQYVHRFLRDVVRLDPTRALVHRLREQLAGRAGPAFSLTIAAAQPISLLRELTTVPEIRPPVSRPKRKREGGPKDEAPKEDPMAVLAAKVIRSVESGVSSLRGVTEELSGDMTTDERFLHAGRIAQTVAEVASPVSARLRLWENVGGDMLIEDWSIPSPRKGNDP